MVRAQPVLWPRAAAVILIAVVSIVALPVVAVAAGVEREPDVGTVFDMTRFTDADGNGYDDRLDAASQALPPCATDRRVTAEGHQRQQIRRTTSCSPSTNGAPVVGSLSVFRTFVAAPGQAYKAGALVSVPAAGGGFEVRVAVTARTSDDRQLEHCGVTLAGQSSSFVTRETPRCTMPAGTTRVRVAVHADAPGAGASGTTLLSRLRLTRCASPTDACATAPLASSTSSTTTPSRSTGTTVVPEPSASPPPSQSPPSSIPPPSGSSPSEGSQSPPRRTTGGAPAGTDAGGRAPTPARSGPHPGAAAGEAPLPPAPPISVEATSEAGRYAGEGATAEADAAELSLTADQPPGHTEPSTTPTDVAASQPLALADSGHRIAPAVVVVGLAALTGVGTVLAGLAMRRRRRPRSARRGERVPSASPVDAPALVSLAPRASRVVEAWSAATGRAPRILSAWGSTEETTFVLQADLRGHPEDSEHLTFVRTPDTVEAMARAATGLARVAPVVADGLLVPVGAGRRGVLYVPLLDDPLAFDDAGVLVTAIRAANTRLPGEGLRILVVTERVALTIPGAERVGEDAMGAVRRDLEIELHRRARLLVETAAPDIRTHAARGMHPVQPVIVILDERTVAGWQDVVLRTGTGARLGVAAVVLGGPAARRVVADDGQLRLERAAVASV